MASLPTERALHWLKNLLAPRSRPDGETLERDPVRDPEYLARLTPLQQQHLLMAGRVSINDVRRADAIATISPPAGGRSS